MKSLAAGVREALPETIGQDENHIHPQIRKLKEMGSGIRKGIPAVTAGTARKPDIYEV